MQILSVLLLTTLVAIAMERCRAEFLLVDVDDEVRKNDDASKKIPGKFFLFSKNVQIEK